MAYFCALEASGAQTECWFADETRVLARRTAGTVKPGSVGEEEATGRLRDLLTRTAAEASVPLHAVAQTCMGLTDLERDGVRQWATETLGKTLGGELLLLSDEEIALQAAFDSGPGIFVSAGTGSVVVGRCRNGTRMRAGGWGPMLGDEGSGYWIGLEAIRTALRGRDRGVPGCLLRAIAQHWRLPDTAALIGLANQRPRPDFATLAPVVSACAAKGDLLARSVLERAGRELAAQVEIVLAKMMATGCPALDGGRVAFAGSILTEIPAVLAELRASLRRSAPKTLVDTEAVQPIEGALARARGA